MKYALCNMRLPQHLAAYWVAQLDQFTQACIDNYGAATVEFGKQDVRGSFSICLLDDKHCCFKQIFFKSKDELLGFIKGYNSTSLLTQ